MNTESLHNRSALPLLGIVVLCTLPHFPYLSPWAVLACCCIWLYAGLAAFYSWPLLPRPILITLSGFFFVMALTTHEGFTIEAFVALLALMTGMKILEIRSERDRMITIILCYFLIVAGMFFSDSIVATLYKLLAILCTTALLISSNFPGRGKESALKLSLTIMVQAVPLMLLLFLFFPRIQGGIWGRTHLNLARTGFTDELSFGSVARLAQDTAIAFRVEFESGIPAQEFLYWRGTVLWHFDGWTWKRNLDHRSLAPEIMEAIHPVRYTVYLEPHNEHWLLTLDMPKKVNLPWARILYDFTAYRWRPVTSRVTYKALSYLTVKVPLREYYREKALQLPPAGNPRARALAETLMREAGNRADYIQRVLRYFKEQPFQYTLTPPPLAAVNISGRDDPDLIDTFLFLTKRGFCEHFAGSFTFLMRAAGVPARIVLGYQGGSLNEYGNYLVVRQSNAHAWCEVWLEERGWVRIDPTAVVAPARISGTAPGELFPGNAGTIFSLRNVGVVGKWLNDLENRMDFYNNLWNKWVLTYSTNEQESFFGTMGIDVADAEGLAQALLLFLVAFVTVLVLINLFLYQRARHPLDETAQSWNSFCRKLSRVGLPRRPEQGPANYMKYVARKRPDLAEEVTRIGRQYIRLRFGQAGNDAEIRFLKTMVRRFSPRKQKQ